MSRAIGSHISAMKRHAASQIMVLTKCGHREDAEGGGAKKRERDSKDAAASLHRTSPARELQ
jgi:hypothetical protein